MGTHKFIPFVASPNRGGFTEQLNVHWPAPVLLSAKVVFRQTCLQMGLLVMIRSAYQFGAHRYAQLKVVLSEINVDTPVLLQSK